MNKPTLKEPSNEYVRDKMASAILQPTCRNIKTKLFGNNFFPDFFQFFNCFLSFGVCPESEFYVSTKQMQTFTILEVRMNEIISIKIIDIFQVVKSTNPSCAVVPSSSLTCILRKYCTHLLMWSFINSFSKSSSVMGPNTTVRSLWSDFLSVM